MRNKSVQILLLAIAIALPSLARAETIFCKQGSPIQSESLASPPRHVLLVSWPDACVLQGDLNLRASASLMLFGKSYRIEGSISLRDSSTFWAFGGTLNIANRYVFEHSIRAMDSSSFSLQSLELVTNAGEIPTSLAANYIGTGRSRFKSTNVRINPFQSWLLATVSENATLETTDSKHVPNEIYPSGAATVRISGPNSESGVWLDFGPGSQALLDQLPSLDAPMNFSFGRNTPSLTNVGYQIDVVNGYAGIGVQSHPGSKVTVRQNRQFLMLNYFFEGDKPVPVMTGPKPGVRQTLSLTDSSRSLELIDALMFPFGWQVYATGNSAAPVVFDGSVINELGSLAGGTMIARRCTFNLAVIASMGGGSHVRIMDSPSIESQSIVADGTGTIHISDSVIHGSLVQARGDSTILLTGNRLETNKRNPFNPPGAPVTFKVDPSSRAKIVVAGLRPIAAGALAPSTRYDVRGDAFIEGTGSASCTYSLSYGKADDPARTPIATRLPCRKSGPDGNVLGSLDTSGIPPGAYVLDLSLEVQGVRLTRVTRSWVLN
jgi:hypothetical protein